MLNDYKNLDVWHKSRDLVRTVYEVVSVFPEDERYGLTAQIKRAVISIPSNIAEGKGRQSKSDFKHFLFIARGSLYEVETQLYLACDLNYVKEEQIKDVFEQVSEIERMLSKLIAYLSN